MAEEARAIVVAGAGAEGLSESRVAFMRYVGQGHEISVPLPAGRLTDGDADRIRAAFEAEYINLYGRIIPGQEPEILSWTVTVAAPIAAPAEPVAEAGPVAAPKPVDTRSVFDTARRDSVDYAVYARDDLAPGATLHGPALIVEDQTTTVVTSTFDVAVNPLGYLMLTAKRGSGA